MDIFLLAKIIAALEWQNLNIHDKSIIKYIDERFVEILNDTSTEFSHLYLEL